MSGTFIMVGSCSDDYGGSTGEETEGRCCRGLPQCNGTLGAYLPQFLHTIYLKLTLFCFVLPRPVWSENLGKIQQGGDTCFQKKGKSG